MELVKKNIHMEQRITWASVQISLEDDQNISDQKPDAYKIICKDSCVKVEETKPVEEAVWVKGTLLYKVLYLTDEKERQLCSLEGTIPFEEKIYTKKNVSGESLRVLIRVEDLSIRLINSRKMNIRSVLDVTITQDLLCDEEVVTDVEEPQTCEILKKSMDVTTIVLDTRDIYRIKEEWEIPDGMPNIYSLIWNEIRIEGLNFVAMDGKIAISGEISAFFLYDGEEEATKTRCFEIHRPFSGILDIPECRENMQLRMEHEMICPNVEVKQDYDGEERLIDLDVELKLYIKLYQNVTFDVVADAYGIREKMNPVMKKTHCEKIIRKECSKIKISDMWENVQEDGPDPEIMHVNVYFLEEETTAKTNEVELSGVIRADILCSVEDENEQYRCISMDIPYTHTIGISGVTEADPVCCVIGMEQAGAVIQGDAIEVRAILTYQLLVYQSVEDTLLADMEKAENETECEVLPVMSVYFAKENENIWEVGKKYRVALADVRNLNDLSGDIMQEGQKILIAKEII